jgi:hypothetical protein
MTTPKQPGRATSTAAAAWTATLYQSDARVDTLHAHTEREARRLAAGLLKRRSLRGARSWDRYQGGTCFQFGQRDDVFVVVREDGDLGYGPGAF